MPMLTWLLLFVVIPSLILVVYSFCDRDELGRVVPTFTWDNYQRAFSSVYLIILIRSIGYAALTTLLCIVIGFPAAWFIARTSSPWRDRLLAMVMIPFWTSFLLRTYAWIAILKSEGLLNAILMNARVTTVPLELLYTPVAVVIGLVYVYLPFMILPIYTSAEKLDANLLDAADDLGATPLRVATHVILPLTWPGIRAGVLMVFIPSLGMFAVTDLLGGARVPLIGNVIQNQFTQARDWPFGAAIGVVFMLLFALGFWWTQRHSTEEDAS